MISNRKIPIFVLWNQNNMKYNEIHKKLRAAGCYPIGNGDHPFWYSPITGRKFKTSHHGSQEAPIGTKKSIARDSGVKL